MDTTTRTRRHDIKVTDDDIAKGIPQDSGGCAVVLAVARAIKDAVRIEVDTQAIRFTREGQRFVYMTPPVVQQYVADFDGGRPISGFGFRLKNPIVTKCRTITPIGKVVDRARSVARRSVLKANPNAKPAEVTAAVTTAADVVRAIHGSGPVRSGQRAAPRVFRTRQRSYGSRVLRINQPLEGSAAESKG